MNDKKPHHFERHCINDLKLINGIHLTAREIDIIACLLNARGTSRMASLLDISPRTVGNHIRNLMVKLGCNSREGIIDFIEKDNKQSLLRVHYSHLTLDRAFQDALKATGKLIPKGPSYSLISWKEQADTHGLSEKLKAHLERTGLTIHLEIREKRASLADLIEESKDGKYAIYMISKAGDDINNIELSHKTSPDNAQTSPKALFLLMEKLDLSEVPDALGGIKCIDFTGSKSYYLSIFEILKALFPHIKLENKIEEFKNRCELTARSHETEDVQENVDIPKELSFSTIKRNFLKEKMWYSLIISLVVVSTLSIGFFTLQDIRTALPTFSLSMRSDLLLPHEARLLERPDLIAEINNKFKSQKGGIQTVTIIGIGGAGKTTLARHYVHQQNTNIVWEINAETRGSLNGSFEKLAYALSTTEQDQRRLKEVLATTDSTTRKEKIISFVKEHLKSREPWFLIYDNVENISDIQKYFPQDRKTWGEGKVLLTTRNNNIPNSSYINQVVYIGELASEQKLNLFIQIMNHGKDKQLTGTQIGEAREFLKHIPPFPLDVSVAAYYLKTANISYAKYLEHLNQDDKDFTAVQEHFLKEAGEYAKTRYSIITLSLKHLMDTHNDFKDLLLFITILNSQNIPRQILDNYKNDVTVNNFIYHLKKHSLIMNESILPSIGLTFSIHRSTQSISLAYLSKTLLLENNKAFIRPIADTLQSYLAESIQKEDFTRMKMMVNHCKNFLNYGTSIGAHHLNLSSQMGRLYYLFGDYVKSQKILEENLEIVNNQGKINYLLKAEFLSYLGNTYKKREYYEKAEALLEQSLAIYKQYFPENDRGLAKNLTYLGSLFIDCGKYEKAKELLEKSLLTYKKYFSDNPNEVARTLVYLGHAYRNLYQPEKSRDLLEKSLAIYKRYFPENHVNIAWALLHLSAPYCDLKEYEKARKCLEKSLAIYQEQFSAQHTRVAWTLAHFGHMHRKLGNYEAAKTAYQKSLSIYEKNYGKNHLANGLVLRNLGRIYVLESKMEAAEKILHQALRIFLKANHPDVYKCFTLLVELNLKKSLEKENKENIKQAIYFKNKAISYLNQARELTKSHFSEESTHLVTLQNKFKTLLDDK